MAFGVTPEGYVLKTQDEINADAETDLKEVRDPVTGQTLEADFSDPSDIVTQITAIPLEGVGIATSQNQAAYNAFDPGKATADSQSNLALIHGITRLAASASTVLLDFTGTIDADVNQGFQVTDVNREINWTTTQPFTFDGFGVATGITASADVVGAISAPTDSLTKFVSNPGGTVATVTNPAPAVIGLDEETDQSLRQRMDISNSKPAFGFPTAINANILNVPGVVFSREYTNNTMITDGNGITAKTLSVVVEGGDDTAVAQAILQSLTAGQSTQGNTSVNFQDNLNNIITINFNRPDPVAIEVVIDLVETFDEPFPDDGVQRIEQAIVDYSTGGAPALGITDDFNTIGFPPGQSVLLTRLFTPVNSVPGHKIEITGIPPDTCVTGLKISRDGNTVEAQDVTIAFNEVATFDIADITVGVI